MGTEQNPMTHEPGGPPVAARLAALDTLPEGTQREVAILAALEDEAPAVRERAIRLAARYIEPQVLGELMADEVNATRRNSAITALERQGPYALSHLEGMLRQYQVDVVIFALQTLARIGDPSVSASVLPFARHPDLNVAQAAIETLGSLRSVEAVPVLIELLDAKLWLQLAAIEALGHIGDARAVEPLLSLIPDSIVAEPALKSLQCIAAPESLEILLTWLPRVRERSLRDSLLVTIGAVIERHPDPTSVAIQHCAEVELDPTRDVLTYLEEILCRPVTDETNETGKLVRSATALIGVGGLRSLFPSMLIRIASATGTSWGEAFLRRYPTYLSMALEELLRHSDQRVRHGALLAGTFGEEDAPRLLLHLEDRDEGIRAAACRALGLAGAVSAVPLLVGRLVNGGPAERAAVIEAFGRLPAGSVTGLESCLGAEVPEAVLLGALEILGKHDGSRFETRIMELTGESSTPVRMAALKAAAKLPGSRADVVLLRALADREEVVQVETLDLLVGRGGAKAAAVLMALLGTGDSLRYHVIRALGHLRATQAAGRLEGMYSECGPGERLEILLALIRIAPPDLAGFLHRRLDELDVEARRLAAHGLAGLGDITQLPWLHSLAEDADWNIRNEAACGLGLLAEPECRDTLLCLVRDTEPVVAQTARAALDRLRTSTPLMVA